MSELRHCEFGYESGFDLDFDPGQHATAESAAKAFFAAIQGLAGELFTAPQEVELWGPDQTREYIDSYGWTVVWESGPSEWGTCTCISGKGWGTAPHWSFSLSFYDS